jgi:hypothetical protein
MTLHEFISNPAIIYGHIDDHRFTELYIRKTNFNHVFPNITNVLTISMIYAKNPGNGSLTQLIWEITQEYRYSVIVEGPSRRLSIKLEKMGFKQIHSLPVYYYRIQVLRVELTVSREIVDNIHPLLPTTGVPKLNGDSALFIWEKATPDEYREIVEIYLKHLQHCLWLRSRLII